MVPFFWADWLQVTYNQCWMLIVQWELPLHLFCSYISIETVFKPTFANKLLLLREQHFCWCIQSVVWRTPVPVSVYGEGLMCHFYTLLFHWKEVESTAFIPTLQLQSLVEGSAWVLAMWLCNIPVRVASSCNRPECRAGGQELTIYFMIFMSNY